MIPNPFIVSYVCTDEDGEEKKIFLSFFFLKITQRNKRWMEEVEEEGKEK